MDESSFVLCEQCNLRAYSMAMCMTSVGHQSKGLAYGSFWGRLAFVYRIEWQARGLPHAHMLLILEHKLMAISQIDAIVSAEMPDPVVT